MTVHSNRRILSNMKNWTNVFHSKDGAGYKRNSFLNRSLNLKYLKYIRFCRIPFRRRWLYKKDILYRLLGYTHSLQQISSPQWLLQSHLHAHSLPPLSYSSHFYTSLSSSEGCSFLQFIIPASIGLPSLCTQTTWPLSQPLRPECHETPSHINE